MMKQKHTETHADDLPVSTMILMKAFYFDEDDLAQNVQGWLSRRQFWRLARWQPLRMGVMIVAMAIIVYVSLGMVDALMQDNTRPPTPQGDTWIGGGILLLLMGLLAAWQFDSWWKLSTDLRLKQVDQMVNNIHTHRTYGRSPGFYLRIGQLEFEVEAGQYAAVQAKGAYRVYYLKRSRRIVAVEWVKDTLFEIK